MANALNARVTGRDDWSTATFQIRTVEGLQSVVGSVRLWFGVHQVRRDAWALSHLPTGVLIGHAPSEGCAFRAVASIRDLIDWSFTDADGGETPKADMVRALLLSHGFTQPVDRPRWRGGDHGLTAERAA